MRPQARRRSEGAPLSRRLRGPARIREGTPPRRRPGDAEGPPGAGLRAHAPGAQGTDTARGCARHRGAQHGRPSARRGSGRIGPGDADGGLADARSRPLVPCPGHLRPFRRAKLAAGNASARVRHAGRRSEGPANERVAAATPGARPGTRRCDGAGQRHPQAARSGISDRRGDPWAPGAHAQGPCTASGRPRGAQTRTHPCLRRVRPCAPTDRRVLDRHQCRQPGPRAGPQGSCRHPGSKGARTLPGGARPAEPNRRSVLAPGDARRGRSDPE